MVNNNISKFLKIVMIISVGLSFIGWFIYDGNSPIGVAIWSAMYKTIQTFVLETSFDSNPVPIVLQIAVYLAPISLAGAVIYKVFNTAKENLISFIFNMKNKDHIIITGSPSFCLEFIVGHQYSKSNTFLFMLPPESKNDLSSKFNNINIIFADPALAVSWKKCAVKNAKTAIVSLASIDEMQNVRDYVEKIRSRSKRKFFLNFALESISQVNFFSHSKLFKDSEFFYVEGFNLQHMAAQQAVEEYAPHFTLSNDYLKVKTPHLVIDGFNEYVKWVIIEAGQLYHYPALKKLKISLFCDNPQDVLDFIQQQPGIDETMDITTIPKGDVFYDFNSTSNSIFPSKSLDPYGLFLFPSDPWVVPEQVRRWRRYLSVNHSNSDYETKIHVFLPPVVQNPSFHKKQLQEYNKLKFTVHSVTDFIHIDRFLDNQNLIDSIALKIHEQYAADSSSSPSTPWPELSDANKEMNRRSARHLKIKLNLVGYTFSDNKNLPILDLPAFTADQIKMFAEIEHKRWNSEKLLEGFVAGEVGTDDNDTKYRKNVLLIHKDIRPFDQLSQRDISKDEETFRDLKSILSEILKSKRLIKL